MGVYIDGNKLAIITEPKIIHFDLTHKVDNSLNLKLIVLLDTLNF